MAPTPQEPAVSDAAPSTLHAERVVISGMSGIYPDAAHVKQLEEILYNKQNPVTTENSRWDFNHPEVRQQTGKLPGLDRFDAQFFKVHYRLGNSMDAMSRKMLEQAYQAIYDAGVSPEHLSGKKIGVYTGTCFSETEKACFYVASSRTGFGIAGCSKAMFANRISYWLNAKGPSMSIDGACCSSMVALEQACQDINRGECEAAVVAGGNLCLHPQSTVHYGRIITLAPDGKAKSFDENADGCSRSEAINVLFLQKAKNAKRIYAEVIHVKNEFTGFLEGETGPKYGFYRNPSIMATFLKQFYNDAKVHPQAIEYIEASGSAVPEADKSELEAFEEVFCKDRTNPLLVGSVMSNIGYGEAGSGISAITKVLLGYSRGAMAGNLHCEKPRTDVSAVRDGRIQILKDHTQFNRSLVAVNQISITGVNAHVLLHGHYEPKDLNRYKSSIPRLVTISGRQDTAVQNILEDLKSRPIDPEEHALFHNIHQTRISGHLGRGYTILDTKEDKTVALIETAAYFDDATRPLWFVYSGMGSQWVGMGTHLLRIPVFAAAIERCRKALEPKGIDIINIITSPDKSMFDNILHSFVGIAAIQIGLTDVLTSVGIKPDKIIGHSVGELGCAYADGCFTAEEMILSAYSRGLVSVQTPFIRGSMAAVGIGYQQIVKLVPPEIEVACHNGPESSTISGPADIMKEFVAKLTAQGIFAKEVPCSNIAYHSRYIAEAGPGLEKYLSEVIKNPKPRSERWVSTSVPQDRWNEPLAKYSSAQYHTNNLLNQVLFEETSRLIPANAVCIEIAPHGLLQAILKRSLPESCKHIPMTRRGHPDNVLMVLDSIGKLYMEGYNPKVHKLYPKVSFPVSTGTPMLSHLVEWAHHEKWSLPLYQNARRKMAASSQILISLFDAEYSYLRGNVLRGKPRYPFAAALIAVWDTYASSLNQKRKTMSLQFRDIHLFSQPIIHEKHTLKMQIAIQRATGQFEIMHGDRKVMSGYINENLKETDRLYNLPLESTETMDLNEDDVYQMLHERDFVYRDAFRSINKTNKSFNEAEIIWKDDWVTYLDGILQLHALRNQHETVAQPFQIRQMIINLKQHEACLEDLKDDNGKKFVSAHVSEIHGITRCGGIIMENVQFRKLPLLDEQPVALKLSKFVPRFKASIDAADALQVYIQTVAENVNKEHINIVGILNKKEDQPAYSELRAILNDVPGVTVNFEAMRRDQVLVKRDHFLNDVDLVFVYNLSLDDSLCQMLYRVLKRDTFLINGEETKEDRIRPSALYRVVAGHHAVGKKLELVKWRPTQLTAASTVVTVRNESELVLLKGTRETLPARHKLVILATYPPVAGLRDMVAQWRKESDRNQIYVVMISEKDNLDELPELDLAYNVLDDGILGGEYQMSVKENKTVKRGVTLRSSRVGDLNSLHWVEAGEPLGDGIPVNVHYTALNDLDVRKASGVVANKKRSELSYCMDFSGITDSGSRVMGVVASGAASGRVKAHKHMLWPVPAHWTLEDAVTVPSAYLHAFYCFAVKVNFRRANKVLIHGGCGALGQAAIAVALACSCEVFVTVSDIRKKRFLMRLFPELKEDHIGNSRDASFGDMVRGILGEDDGCNVAISCVRGGLKNVTMNCLTFSSIMLDTVQLQDQEPYNFGMYYLTKERNYVPIDFTSVFESNEELQKLQILISEGIARGYVRPLSRVTYSPDEVPRAFKLLAASRHRGRVVLKLNDNIKTDEPRLICSSDLTHVVLCDSNTLGLHLAERLIERGARKLSIHCTNPTKYLRLKIQSWENLGVKIQLSSEDLTNISGVISLLNESNKMAPVEGIYIIATNVTEHTAEKMSGVVSNVDLTARKLCPSVRYFAVIGAGLGLGQKTCTAREKDNLPATSLNIPSLRKSGSPLERVLHWRAAVSAAERALCSSQALLTAHARELRQRPLLQEIADVADIEVSNEIMEDTTLVELGMELATVPAVCSYLKNKHDVTLSEDVVTKLTMQKIKELEEAIYGYDLPAVNGLGAFFSFVDSDELLATTEITFLSTRTNTIARADEFDTNKNYLCIIPGLEGHHHLFRVLCERLKIDALILQPGLDHLQESFKDTADRYAKILMNKAALKNNFYLLGYESGVLVALEVAAILEKHGLTGTVFCVGGTPEEFHTELDKQLHDIPTDEALQDAVAQHMFSLMTGSTEGVDKALQNASSWKEKIEACVRTLLGKVHHSAQYARNLMEAAYSRIKMARLYKVQPEQLKSKLILLHAKDMTAGIDSVSLLQKYSQQPVSVYELSEPLAHCTQDLRCSAIINSNLDEEIITAYEESNICDTYLLNADQFIMNASDVGKE